METLPVPHENGHALQRVTPLVPVSFEDVQRFARMFAASGYFKDAHDVAQAGVKILAGREFGLTPLQAMRSIHVFDGKIELHASLIASLIEQHAEYDYEVLSATPEGCEIAFLRAGERRGTASFTIEDAKKAGLAGKSNWKNYPEDMCFARAMSRGARRYCPTIFTGVYTEGEISEEVPVGEALDVGEDMAREYIEAETRRRTAADGPPVPEEVLWVDADELPEGPGPLAEEPEGPEPTPEEVDRAKLMQKLGIKRSQCGLSRDDALLVIAHMMRDTHPDGITSAKDLSTSEARECLQLLEEARLLATRGVDAETGKARLGSFFSWVALSGRPAGTVAAIKGLWAQYVKQADLTPGEVSGQLYADITPEL